MVIRRDGQRRQFAFLLTGFLLLAFANPGTARSTGGTENPVRNPENRQPTAEEHLPPAWRSYYVREPVLGSTIRVATVGKRGRPPMLLVHGLGQNGLKDWLKIGEAFRDDYYIVALDLPGFGQSTLPSGRLSPENLADLVHWLVRDQDLGRIHLAGHSMGGAVALYYAAKYPETLTELTIIDAAGVLHRAAFVKSMAEPNREAYRFLPEALQRPAAKVLNWSSRLVEEINLLPDLTRPLQESDLAWNSLLQDQANTNAALALVNTDYSPVIAAIGTPTRIIWGRRDPMAPLRTGHMLRGLIANSELHIIPDAEHVPIQTHAAEVTELMRREIEPESLRIPSGSSPDLTCRGRTGQ
jgi:pimeloyl-ACP methyl ester carboxylesterase